MWISEGGCSSGCCFPQFSKGNPSRNKKSACCFDQGRFSSHALLGYQEELHHPPTPMYRHNRTHLVAAAKAHGVNSREAFLSAHEVLPGMITSHCPLVEGAPLASLDKYLTMITEQKVSLVVSLDPSSRQSSHESTQAAASTGPAQSPVVRCKAWGRDVLPRHQRVRGYKKMIYPTKM